MKKVPDPAGQKSTDPTGSGSSSLTIGIKLIQFIQKKSRIEKEPITSLCRMHIHPERLAAIPNDKIIDIFTDRKPRRLEYPRLEDIGSNNSHFFNQKGEKIYPVSNIPLYINKNINR